MKKVYSVYVFNGINWKKQCSVNEYFDVESAEKELKHIEKVWLPRDHWHSVRYIEVPDDYVLKQGETLPKIPKRTPWGTLYYTKY